MLSELSRRGKAIFTGRALEEPFYSFYFFSNSTESTALVGWMMQQAQFHRSG
jgi:hypothetical protein